MSNIFAELIKKNRDFGPKKEQIIDLSSLGRTQKNMRELHTQVENADLFLSDLRYGNVSKRNYLESNNVDENTGNSYTLKARLDQHLSVCGTYTITDEEGKLVDDCVFCYPYNNDNKTDRIFLVISNKDGIFTTATKRESRENYFGINTHSTLLDGCVGLAKMYSEIKEFVNDKRNQKDNDFDPQEIDITR